MDAHLLRFNQQQKYLFFDFESENLSLCYKNRPWNCAFIVWQNRKVLEEHDYYPWWADINVSPGAAVVTKFNLFDYKNKAEDAKKILKIFENYLYDPQYIPVGQNIMGFDIALHSIWRREFGLKSDYSYIDRAIDTNSVAKLIELGVKEIKPEDRKVMMLKMSTFKQKGMKTNLTALGKKYNIEFDYVNMVHQGLNDVRLNSLVFQKQIWDIAI